MDVPQLKVLDQLRTDNIDITFMEPRYGNRLSRLPVATIFLLLQFLVCHPKL